jgi:large subunit ribosomal protein L29
MKAKQIAELTLPELKEKLEIESEGFRKMKLTHAVSTLESPIQLRTKRRLIARLQSELVKRNKAQTTK